MSGKRSPDPGSGFRHAKLRDARSTAFEVALAILQDPDGADDVAQATIVQLARTSSRFEEGVSLAKRIARNLALNRLRDHRRRLQIREQESRRLAPKSIAAPDELLWRREIRRRVALALRTLPGRQRQVAVHCMVKGRSYREAAKRMGISYQTVANQLLKARRRIRAFLGHME